jgi:hypothetical protein
MFPEALLVKKWDALGIAHADRVIGSDDEARAVRQHR